MARPKKSAAIDLSVTHELSHGLIERLTCPVGQLKAFLRDKDVTGLRVRVTANGAKAFVYEAKLNGKAISKTLGKIPIMSIDEAKDAARVLANQAFGKGRLKKVPLASGWTEFRDMPAPQGKTFHQLWKERRS